MCWNRHHLNVVGEVQQHQFASFFCLLFVCLCFLENKLLLPSLCGAKKETPRRLYRAFESPEGIRQGRVQSMLIQFNSSKFELVEQSVVDNNFSTTNAYILLLRRLSYCPPWFYIMIALSLVCYGFSSERLSRGGCANLKRKELPEHEGLLVRKTGSDTDRPS